VAPTTALVEMRSRTLEISTSALDEMRSRTLEISTSAAAMRRAMACGEMACGVACAGCGVLVHWVACPSRCRELKLENALEPPPPAPPLPPPAPPLPPPAPPPLRRGLAPRSVLNTALIVLEEADEAQSDEAQSDEAQSDEARGDESQSALAKEGAA
jgi:hypothetical protein